MTSDTAASVALVDKDAAELATWLPTTMALYVQARMDAGDTADQARTAAEESQAAYFPDGVPADGHRIFTITADGDDAGWLWIGPFKPGADWWIWDIEVHEPFRRRGIGEAAMRLAEDVARTAGSASLGLNVFGGNETARRLYERVGYAVTAVHMRKTL
ncbi:MAG: GNAT family N-acetyltransferase [Leifsonia sp.]